MVALVEVHHRTAYSFDRSVVAAPHLLRLRPLPTPSSTVRHHEQHISPDGHVLHWQRDPFGNQIARVSFPEPIRGIVVEVEVIVELAPRNPFGFLLDRAAERFPFGYGAELSGDLQPYLGAEAPRPDLVSFVDDLDLSGRLTTDVLVTLGHAVASAVEHQVRRDPGVLSPDATLLGRTGSCRDSAWLLVQLLRLVGLAARFVSGYLVEPATTGDLTDLHAWVEVYLPGAGWVGIDATSGLLVGEGHIPLAVSRNPRGAAPVEGTTEPCRVQLVHTISCSRVT